MDDDEILSELEALHPAAFGWAVSCCRGDWHRGEDVLQAAYVKAVVGKVKFKECSALKTWWFGIIRMTAFEEARTNSRWYALLDRWRREPEVQDRSTADLPEESGHFSALAAALAELSERQAQVLHLAFYEELRLSEAAAIMCISVGSARQHYERGKRRLRELLQLKVAPHD